MGDGDGDGRMAGWVRRACGWPGWAMREVGSVGRRDGDGGVAAPACGWGLGCWAMGAIAMADGGGRAAGRDEGAWDWEGGTRESGG